MSYRNEVSLRWSADGAIETYRDFSDVSDYAWSVEWENKDTIPVNKQYSETTKFDRRASLSLTALLDRLVDLPQEFIWVEMGIGLGGNKWWTRSGKYRILEDRKTYRRDDLVLHQLSLSSQGAIDVAEVFRLGKIVILPYIIVTNPGVEIVTNNGVNLIAYLPTLLPDFMVTSAGVEIVTNNGINIITNA